MIINRRFLYETFKPDRFFVAKSSLGVSLESHATCSRLICSVIRSPLKCLISEDVKSFWLVLLSSISQRNAVSARAEALEENRRTLTSPGVVEEPREAEAEARAGIRGDERGDKHHLLSENGAKIPFGRNVNVSE